MEKKQYAVFGLGKFGLSVANTLAAAGCEVMVVDSDMELIREVADDFTCAVQADVTEPRAMMELGLSNIDVAVVGLSENMEASILATILAKEAGVPYVMAKALSQMQGTILKKVGADDVVFPERDFGVHVAQNLLSGGFVDYFSLSDNFSMAELRIPSQWDGKSLQELDLRSRYRVNIIAVKREKEIKVMVQPEDKLIKGQLLIAIGENKDIERLTKLENQE